MTQVVPLSEAKQLQAQVRELERLLAKKTLEAEILKAALEQTIMSSYSIDHPRDRAIRNDRLPQRAAIRAPCDRNRRNTEPVCDEGWA